jgi:hypothetical protein
MRPEPRVPGLFKPPREENDMTSNEARTLAEAFVPQDTVVLATPSVECELGFYFQMDSRAHQKSGRVEDLLIGTCGLLVDRANGDVHMLGSGQPPDY